MSNYNNLKTSIDANIKQNGNQEITGPILNSVLNQMVNILGTGYQFAGVATLDPATNPGTPDAKVFYIANGKGTYTNFGGIEVTEDDVVVLYWDSAWHKVVTGIASQAKLSELSNAVIDIKTESIEVDGFVGSMAFHNTKFYAASVNYRVAYFTSPCDGTLRFAFDNGADFGGLVGGIAKISSVEDIAEGVAIGELLSPPALYGKRDESVSVKKGDIIALGLHANIFNSYTLELTSVVSKYERIAERVVGLESAPNIVGCGYMALFKNAVCIGDSLTRGYQAEYPSGQKNRDGGYPTRLSRLTRLNVYNYGHSGATPTSWMAEAGNKDFTNFDVALICLGRNGGLSSTDDVANYKAIIDKLISANSNMTIFCLSLPPSDGNAETDKGINEIIKSIASEKSAHYIDIYNDVKMASPIYRNDGVHYYPLGYYMMAEEILVRINEYIDKNKGQFMQIYTPQTYDNIHDSLVE